MKIEFRKNVNVSTGRFRSFDLWVMGPARFHCATVLNTENLHDSVIIS